MVERKIIENKKIHNKIFLKYDKNHGEIFTKVEQKRIFDCLNFAKENIKTTSKIKSALDIGCGTGNLSNFLLDIGFKTTGADISENFLKFSKKRFLNKKLDFRTVLLNGEDLNNIENNSFDFVGLYSVLHHIPDYLKMVKEMFLVTKKGGVIYVDHEVNSNYWNKSLEYNSFLKKVRFSYFKSNFFNIFSFKSITSKIIQIKNPRFRAEGDIHVFKDDHIEWEKITQMLINLGCEIVYDNDYLLYKKGYKLDLYNKYKNKCSDYKTMIFRKI